ncbi:MAG: hypothetical protein ABSA93_34050 [Streptosporangiaceae bacterium]
MVIGEDPVGGFLALHLRHDDAGDQYVDIAGMVGGDLAVDGGDHLVADTR